MFRVFFLSFILFSAKRMLRYLRYFQQEGYDARRFLAWVWGHKAFDKKGTLVLLFTAVCSFFFQELAWVLGCILFLFLFLWEEDPKVTGKIQLQMTSRAKRIFACTLLLYFFAQTLTFSLDGIPYWTSQIILLQSIPLVLVLSILILSLDESRRQKLFRMEAKKLLEEVSPYVIGITGSYGKTSTKHALGEVMQVVLGSTFWPSKGVNTEMGITREIRNHLKKGFQYAVIEMGAYGKGSIEKLCCLTPPNAAIITEIGLAHLDRFGDPDTIRIAKSELAQAIPQEGIFVVNGDSVGARRIAEEHPKQTTLLYGYNNDQGDLDCWIENFSIDVIGMHFSFRWKGDSYQGTTQLLGKPALANLAAVFSMACALGADPEFTLGAIANLRPVDNRLQLVRENEISYLRDAYNSNPQGFDAALDVLSQFSVNKKILMTPGMIELGDQSAAIHEKIGRKAAQVCDLAIIVGSTNQRSLVRGLTSGGMDLKKIVPVESRKKAFEVLKTHSQKGDAVLIENDLPDIHEAQERF